MSVWLDWSNKFLERIYIIANKYTYIYVQMNVNRGKIYPDHKDEKENETSASKSVRIEMRKQNRVSFILQRIIRINEKLSINVLGEYGKKTRRQS